MIGTIIFVALAIFMIMAASNGRFLPGGKKTTKCKYCKSEINIHATRCPCCNSDVTPPEQTFKGMFYFFVALIICMILVAMGVITL